MRLKKKDPQYLETIRDIGVHRVPADAVVLSGGEKIAIRSARAGAFTTSPIKDREKEKPEEEMTQSLRSRYRRTIEIPLKLLEKRGESPSSGDISANKDRIRQALESFGIVVEMGRTSTGPTVTQYTLKPQEGVKLSHITALTNDLALALAAHPIRIEAPIPGQALVGIEVPNSVIATVAKQEIQY
jgi:S-DNA-T family DNA segregation ATPase FtsK/SpoIIIE